jgi:predicted HicB family RNase H-like nuclease
LDETKLENGFDIPEPVTETPASGKFTLRLPKTLHNRLTIEAKKEGVSLNQYALYKLAK